MDELIFSSAATLAREIQAGRLSSEEVVAAHLARIEALNPRINAVVQMAPGAIEWARQADEDLARGVLQGALHGVPFTVKDVLATAGLDSPLDQRLRQRRNTVDATVVARLHEAGGILLAKTNCPPSGGGSDTENAICGRTLNPHALDHTPGGSSGGEAALIAAGGSPLGLGGDTGGGLRVPAHYCGVAALKPTVGRVPNTGAYNQPGGLTDPRTQIGPLARTVDDLALVFRTIAGPDYIDSGAVPMPLFDPEEVDLADLRAAFFAEDPVSPVDPAVAAAVDQAARALAQAGAELEEARPRDLVGGGRDVDRGWRELAGTRGQDIVELYGAWDHYRTGLLQFMIHYDAILCPVDHHPAPPYQERDAQRFDYTVPFSLAGFPSVVVPTAMTPQGLPLGVQVVAHPWREDVALALARVVERASGGWRRPALG